MMFDLITLNQAKDWLNISGSSEDDFLDSLISISTEVIENYIGTFVIPRLVVEYHSLSRLRPLELVLNKLPVYSNSAFKIYNDPDREFGEDTEITDYAIDENTGIVYLQESVSTGYNVFKVQYYAGWARFKVWYNMNDKLIVDEGSGDVTVTVDYGKYNAEDLADKIETALNAVLTNTYTVSYDYSTQKFTITSTASVTFKFSNSSIASLIGFSIDATGTSFTSEKGVNGIPKDLILVAQKLVFKWFAESGKGDNIQELRREIINDAGTREYLQQAFPVGVTQVLDKYSIF